MRIASLRNNGCTVTGLKPPARPRALWVIFTNEGQLKCGRLKETDDRCRKNSVKNN
jgi:hypothetical protein